jgi:hypothetical protein
MVYSPETETHAQVHAPTSPICFFPRFSAPSHDDFDTVVNSSSCAVCIGHRTA